MKLTRKVLFIELAILFLSTSCTMEKRVYMTGYNFEWNISKRNPVEEHKFVRNENEKQTAQNKITTIKKPENDTNFSCNPKMTVAENSTASIDNYPLILPQKKYINLLVNNAVEKQIKSIKKKETTIHHADESESKINLASVFGFIFGIAGIVLFFAISVHGLIYFIPAIISTILSIVLSAIGLRKTKKEPDKWKGRGFAKAGLVLGILPLAFLLLLFILLLNWDNGKSR